jgi:hypothetical protein
VLLVVGRERGEPGEGIVGDEVLEAEQHERAERAVL